jgi:hypothetical protein
MFYAKFAKNLKNFVSPLSLPHICVARSEIVPRFEMLRFEAHTPVVGTGRLLVAFCLHGTESKVEPSVNLCVFRNLV